MDYAAWQDSVPDAITHDPLWRVEAHRLALFAACLGCSMTSDSESAITNDESRITNHASRITVSTMLFDLDGTLIDSRTDLANSINLMLADLGRPSLDEAIVGGFVGDGVRVLVRRCLTATDPQQKPPSVDLHANGVELMHRHYAEEMFKTTRLYPQVAETLAALDKLKAVVTSKEVRFTKLILEHFDIARYFHAIVGGDTTPARKPDPAPVLEALRLLDASAGDAVMIGDSENDINAGRAAGTRTCGVTFGFRTAEQLRLCEPDVLVDRFDKLRDFLI
jgi:phosphoglycolate phosphatase